MRKSYTAEIKAKVALEAVKGERSLSELASKYEVHLSATGRPESDWTVEEGAAFGSSGGLLGEASEEGAGRGGGEGQAV